MPSNSKKSPTKALQPKKLLIIGGSFLLVASVLAILLNSKPADQNQLNNSNPRATFSPLAANIDIENAVFKKAGVTPLDNCQQVLEYYQENALKQVTPWGLDDMSIYRGLALPALDVAEDSAADISAPQSLSANESQTSASQSKHSSTNIQVEGVDEADMVKTDGQYIYIVSNQTLKIVDIRQNTNTGEPQLAAKLSLGFWVETTNSMLLSLKTDSNNNLKDTLILVGTNSWPDRQVRLVQINIEDRTNPEVVADFTIDGNYIGMRLVGNTVRLIMNSTPLGLGWQSPAGSGLNAQEEALEANKQIILNSDLNNWIPAYKDSQNRFSRTSPLVDCSQMLAPNIFSGLNTLSIMTFNASEQLKPGGWQAIGLAADANSQDIYATAENVYVAASEILPQAVMGDRLEIFPIRQPSSGLETIIHKFGTTEANPNQPDTPRRPIYMASGKVVGFLLNQFSMDEHKGDLRVAVTVNSTGITRRQNHVKILRPTNGILHEIGSVEGLGINESIESVRFMGDQAYVVTFERIDPLYALDLSDPTNPRALGELKITGFSSYLHPVAEGLLLGVGQEADLTGRIEGLQISLFDVSDATNPRRIDQKLLKEVLISNNPDTDHFVSSWSHSPVENNHHAFLFHDNLSYIPYRLVWRSDDWRIKGDARDSGILVVSSQNRVLSIRNILRAPSDQYQQMFDSETLLIPKNIETDGQVIYLEPTRTVVVGGLVYGISPLEVVVWQGTTGKLLHTIEFNDQIDQSVWF